MDADKRKQIFNTICEVVVDQEFVNSQADFYIQNCKVFTDAEENTHEYMKIFEEYVHIVDQAIDSQLSSQYE